MLGLLADMGILETFRRWVLLLDNPARPVPPLPTLASNYTENNWTPINQICKELIIFQRLDSHRIRIFYLTTEKPLYFLFTVLQLRKSSSCHEFTDHFVHATKAKTREARSLCLSSIIYSAQYQPSLKLNIFFIST